jgi:16S rRNA (uracil1498-N3)-methyltransferase
LARHCGEEKLMPRFYANSSHINGDKLLIAGDEARHIKNALRMQPGDTVTVFDGSGIDYDCFLTAIGSVVEAAIVSRHNNETEPDIAVTLYQAYPKSAKMEEIVQKAVELGASGIVPFISSRCVKRPEDATRLRRVALSAVKQCGRSIIPEVTDILGFDAALERMRAHDLLIVCWEEERQITLKDALAGTAHDIGVVIGSEGGFEAGEVNRMRDAGGVSVTLGPRILRTETAGIAVLAAVFYDKGQMQY